MNRNVTILLSALLVVVLACNKEQKGTIEEVSYKVVLNVGGEISTSESPLTKGADSDLLLGIVILKDGEHYGGGLFDTTEGITVNLLSGHSYTFKSTLITNGKTVLYFKNYGDDVYYCQCTPFISAALTNEIGYKSLTYGNFCGEDMASPYHGIDSHSYSLYSDRYYGEVSGYSPTENGTIDLELKHTVIGAKYVVSGLTDGTLNLSIVCGSHTLFSEAAISSNMESDGVIFECDDVHSAWQNFDTYKESATVTLKWTRGTGITQDLGSVTIDLLRNRMNNIRINLDESGTDNTLGFNVDNTNMGKESINVSLL